MSERICAGRVVADRSGAPVPVGGECPVERRACDQAHRNCRDGCQWMRFGRRPTWMGDTVERGS